ncbi:hypothetical protein LPH50_10025 [Xylella taiwanensis]|uniref:Uncharacterized protein n=2 Tax=Xylella taiwanensis TaxID=1444770 RepID=A0ABS8TYH8_9GAMM|nr:hypothetical protein [Xylella taiwanensis]MCD8456269.1 hypothetical protein [Xylella taiwanensis]MCD8458677.1 hypothetical protein [Xylella taiwanensis]MCD8460812.1 hypothetical protein [Xylella taiwanensis]MCD8463130.1 hypothetical protein [Xylella taiwanensis]MCD8465318.1 hypothetical protein [Xylella taiwanensis]
MTACTSHGTVSTTGTATFRGDDCLNGRRETLTIRRYGRSGIALAMASETRSDAEKDVVAQSQSPAQEKQRRLTAAKIFCDLVGKGGACLNG